MAASEAPPGPRIPPLAQAAMVLRDPYDWMRRRHRRYGDVFSSRFPFFGQVVYVVDPVEVKRLFAGDPASFHAGEANAMMVGEPLGANSLLTLDEDAHMRQRKLLLPPFHGERIRRYVDVMVDATEREVASWPLDRAFPTRPGMLRITLDVILRAVFGVRDEQRMDRFRETIPRVGDATSPLDVIPSLRRDFGRWSPAARMRRALADSDRLIYEEIALRRAEASSEERDDVLSMLLAARDEDGRPMSDVELRDELMTLIAAGHETSATGLAWAFERLVRTPAVLEHLQDEPDDDEYLDAVVRETLRSRPVVTDVARVVQRETEVGGYVVPAGTIVLAGIAAMHARPQSYPDWPAFRPERFLAGDAEPYTWIPFGGGVRRCIGAAFAQTEMKVVLREVLRRVRLRADRPRPERPRIRHVTVVPACGARVVVTARIAASAKSVAHAATA